jgi:hypothetical protein
MALLASFASRWFDFGDGQLVDNAVEDVEIDDRRSAVFAERPGHFGASSYSVLLDNPLR